jgi:hypothetical protein
MYLATIPGPTAALVLRPCEDRWQAQHLTRQLESHQSTIKGFTEQLAELASRQVLASSQSDTDTENMGVEVADLRGDISLFSMAWPLARPAI